MDRLRQLDRDRFDAIVVGAGIGGLTAAAILARRGKSVLVLDPALRRGGNATVFRRKAYEFDVGLHYIGQCAAGEMIPRMLHSAGVDGVRFRELDRDGFETYVFPDLRFRVPASLDLFRERLVAVSPREARGIDRYCASSPTRGRWSRYPPPVAHLRPHELRARRVLTALHVRHARRRGSDALELSPALRGILAARASPTAYRPAASPAFYHAVIVMHYATGAYYPEGGGQELSDRLAESLERADGRVLLLATAKRILVESGRHRRHLREPAPGPAHRPRPAGDRQRRLPRHHARPGRPRPPPPPAHRVGCRDPSPAPRWRALRGGRPRPRSEGVPNSNHWWFPDFDTEAQYAEILRGGGRTWPT